MNEVSGTILGPISFGRAGTKVAFAGLEIEEPERFAGKKMQLTIFRYGANANPDLWESFKSGVYKEGDPISVSGHMEDAEYSNKYSKQFIAHRIADDVLTDIEIDEKVAIPPEF